MKLKWNLLITLIAFCLFILISSCGGGGGGGTDSSQLSLSASAPPITWSTKSPMNIPRTECGVASVNGKLYAIGGYSGSVLKSVEEYDPSTDHWTTKANMPTARRLLVVAAVNNKIYAIGGMNFTNPNGVTYSYATEEYDPSTDTWATKASLPTGNTVNSILGNRFLGGAAINGKIYVAVYNNAGTAPITQTFQYDPAANTWSEKTPVPFTYTRLAVTSLNGKLYALADATNSGAGGSFLAEYDPIKDAWAIKPPAGISRSWTGLAAAGGRLYAVGGARAGNAVTTVEAFDPVSGMWGAMTSVSVPRCSSAIAELGGRIYVVGGSANYSEFAPQPLATVEEGIVPAADQVMQAPTDVAITVTNTSANISWTPVAGATSYNIYIGSDPKLSSASIVNVTGPYTVQGLSYGRTYYFAVTSSSATNESAPSRVVSATPAVPGTLQWQSSPAMPTPRMYEGAATVNGKIYIVGGYSGSTLHTVEAFDPVSGQWSSKADMPTARSMSVVATVNAKIYVIGGMSYNDLLQVSYTNVTEVYDPATDTWSSKKPLPNNYVPNNVFGNLFIAGAAANGKIYVVVFAPGHNATYEYDPATDAWTVKSPVPIGDYKPYAVTALNNKLYVLTSSFFAEYDPANDLWTIKSSLATFRSLAGLIAVPSRNKLYAVGGVDSESNVLQSVTSYDPNSNAWAAEVSVPIPLKSLAVGEIDGKVYLFGGVSNADTYYPVPLNQVIRGSW